MARRALTISIVTLLVTAGIAHAAFTTPVCLAKKVTAWTTLRKCQATERGKQLLGKTADLTKCQTKFDAKLTATNDKATASGIPCRYADHGDSTVIDYDTGLQWEKKTGTDLLGICPRGAINCVLDVYTRDAVQAFVVNTSADHLTFTGVLVGFAGHSDWRLPTIVELVGIMDLSVAGCGIGLAPPPCIDPIFGPTVVGSYWSTTAVADNPSEVWVVGGHGDFGGGIAEITRVYVRAVRSAL